MFCKFFYRETDLSAYDHPNQIQISIFDDRFHSFIFTIHSISSKSWCIEISSISLDNFRETDLLACDHPNQMAFGLGSNYTNRPY